MQPRRVIVVGARSLAFPRRTTDKPIEQAKRQAAPASRKDSSPIASRLAFARPDSAMCWWIPAKSARSVDQGEGRADARSEPCLFSNTSILGNSYRNCSDESSSLDTAVERPNR